MIAEKDEVIASHRKLVYQLHKCVEGQNSTISKLKNAVVLLSEELLKHKVPLPESLNAV